MTHGIAPNSVLVVDDFVDKDTCESILKEHEHGEWVTSGVVLGKRGQIGVDAGRTSQTLAQHVLGGFTVKFLNVCSQRLERLAGIKHENLEPWHLTRYGRRQKFDYHLDCGAWRRHVSGERLHTILIVIEQPKAGGSTHFRALNKSIKPIAGRLLIWRNLLDNGECNHAMIHAGRTVWEGRKTILTTWEHQRRYPKTDTGD